MTKTTGERLERLDTQMEEVKTSLAKIDGNLTSFIATAPTKFADKCAERDIKTLKEQTDERVGKLEKNQFYFIGAMTLVYILIQILTSFNAWEKIFGGV